jgi:hypothetical protein
MSRAAAWTQPDMRRPPMMASGGRVFHQMPTHPETALSRLAKSALLVLILVLVVFYLAWQAHKIRSNILTNSATVIGGFAGVLWAAQNTGPRFADGLDRMLLFFIPRRKWLQVIGGVVGLALFGWAVWRALAVKSLPQVHPSTLPPYVWWSGFLILMVIGIVGIQSSADILEKFSGRFGLGEAFQTNFIILVVIFLFLFGSIHAGALWALGLYTSYFLGVGLLRVVLSPIPMSDSLKELAEGRSITLGFVTVLCGVSFFLFIAGLLV